MQRWMKRARFVLVPLALVIVLSGCSGSRTSSTSVGARVLEDELYSGLAYFCQASDNLNKTALSQIFSRQFSAAYENLDIRLQLFMDKPENEWMGNTLEYDELMQYFDWQIQNQEGRSTTTIVEFVLIYELGNRALTSHSLSIMSSTGVAEEGNGQLTWIQESGTWKIKSIGEEPAY